MINECTNENGEKIYKYQTPSKEQLFESMYELQQMFNDYLAQNNIDKNHVQYDKRLISEIFIRVDKRKDYFIIYHDETYINEVKEAALLAYWIVKFKPFTIISDDMEERKKNINCGFAACIILSAVNECLYEATKKKKELQLSETYINKFLYALKHWDLSKEAFMLIAETLCEHVLAGVE